VAQADRVRALGTGHSFSPIADTTGTQVSLVGLPPLIELDPTSRRVRVGGGVQYTELAPRLNAAGFALPNLASLPHISVAGACATHPTARATATATLQPRSRRSRSSRQRAI
jgi:xylitol oxidase